jgi:hypothetical protein
VIDRKTALACAVLIGLMLVAAVWRIIMRDHWAMLAVQNGAPWPSLWLFAFPACSALVVGALYWDSRGAKADETRIQPWRQWAKSLSLSYCGGLLLLQSLIVVQSLDLAIPWDLSAIGRTLGVVLAIICVMAINQMPKLPWFERRFAPGGELGPIYGPRYMRTQSTILVVFMLAVIAYDLAVSSPTAWHSTPYILVATGCLVGWSVVWRYRLGRRWRLERSATP